MPIQSADGLPGRLPQNEKILIEMPMVRDLLVHLLQGISPYADALRRYSVTDKEIDMFTAEALASAVSIDHFEIHTIERFIAAVKDIRERAKTLYTWACEAYARTPRSFGDITAFECAPADVLVVAEQVRKDKYNRLKERGTLSWDDLCVCKLGSFASILISSADFNTTAYDAYGFIHKTLCRLTSERSIFELAALVHLIEKETLQLVNFMVSGNTLVDMPFTQSSVRASKIVVIDRIPETSGGVMRDRV